MMDQHRHRLDLVCFYKYAAGKLQRLTFILNCKCFALPYFIEVDQAFQCQDLKCIIEICHFSINQPNNKNNHTGMYYKLTYFSLLGKLLHQQS